MSGYVYLFRQKKTNYYKIGYTTSSVESRFVSMNMYSPNGAEIVSFIKTENPKKLERFFHNHYKEFRLNGEFFNLAPCHVEYFLKFEENQLKKFIELCKTFFLKINDPQKAILRIETLIKTQTIKDDEDFDFSTKVLKIIDSDLSGKKMTSGEIYDYLNDKIDLEIPKRKFGILLSATFEAKRVRRGGIVSRVYLL